MYDFYKKYSFNKFKEAKKKLNALRKKIPETVGCEVHSPPGKEGGCESWCCRKQSPSAMFSEFLDTWTEVERTWTQREISEIMLKAVERYLFPDSHAGCIFHDGDSNRCRIHRSRSLNCHFYGQIPEDCFETRRQRLTVLYPDKEHPSQCNLVKTKGPRPTADDINAWFKELTFIEEDFLGKGMGTDADGGSYRHYHDHVLLHLCDEEILGQLTSLRVSGSESEKKRYMKRLSNLMKMQSEDPYGSNG